MMTTDELKNKINSVRSKMQEKLGDTFVKQFDDSMKQMNVDRAISKIDSLYRELKGSGQYGKANALKSFMTELKKVELDRSFENKINEIRTLLGENVEPRMLEKFDKALQKSTSHLVNFWYKLSNVGKMLFSGITIKGIMSAYYALKRWIPVIRNIVTESSGFIENLHLFEVSMGAVKIAQGKLDKAASGYYLRGIKYQNQMHEMYATNMSQTIKYQGLFNQMAKSMGIPEEAAYNLSESLTTVGMDLSSLYNIEQTAAMQKLRAGIAGQTKPLRDLGLDITAQSLTPILEEAGINRSVKNLSQAEKMLVRYIAILKQAKAAHGDYANTINLPANQLKIFSNQIKELTREIGNVFLPILKNVLPIINGFIMALKEVVHFIAILCGYTEDLAQGMSSLTDDSDENSVDLGFDDELENAKKLKQYTVGFDELNILKPKDDSSNGGVGGVDPALLALMDKYNEDLVEASNRAIEIRDHIMEWLGFTKEVDDETGEVTWKLGEGYTKLELIRDILKVIAGIVAINIIGKIIKSPVFQLIWSLLTGILKLLYQIGKFVINIIAKIAVAAFHLLTKAVKFLLSHLKQVLGIILIVLGAIGMFKTYSKIVDQGTMSFKDMWDMLKAIALVVVGIGLAIGWLPALIAALVLSIFNLFVTISTYWEEIKTMFTKDFNNIGAEAMKVFITVGAKLVAAAKTIIHAIDTSFNGFMQMIYDAFGNAILWIAEKFEGMISFVTTGINKIRKFFGGEELEGFSLTASVQAMMDENKKTLDEKNENYWEEMEEINKNMQELLDGIENQRKENETQIFKEYLDRVPEERLEQLNETKKQNDEFLNNIKSYFKDGIEAPSLSQRAMQTSEDMNLETHEQTDILKNISDQLGGMNIENILSGTDTDDFDSGDSQALDDMLANTSDLTSFMEDTSIFSEEMLNTDNDILDTMKYTQGLESDSGEKLENINTYLNTNLSNILQQIKRACENIRINIIKNYYYGDTQGYATGGMPESASLFYAHENGIPELVGRVGNKTGVMNNEQIVEAVSLGVASAVAQVMSREKDRPINVSVQVDDREIARANNSGQKKLGYSIVGGAFANG